MYDAGVTHAPFAHKFTGKERDTESGLDYFGARHDNPSLGRFMQTDPKPDSSLVSNPQSLNRYAYVQNNPLKFVDIRGECVSPALGPGQVGICIESYIRAPRMGILHLGLGDNRGPVANDPDATFRTQTLVTIDLKTHAVSGESKAGISEVLFKGAYPKPGIVHASIGKPTVDDKGNIHFSVSVYGENGHEAAGNPLAPGGWIEMVFEFLVDPSGKVVITGQSGKDYPSVSVFSYSNGATNDLFEQTESGDSNDLNKPAHGLGNIRNRFDFLEDLIESVHRQEAAQ